MKSIILAALGAVTLAVPAAAQPASTCFSIRDYQSWKSPDARTIYVKVSGDRYYKLGLASDCAGLQWVGVHLVTKSRTDSVCGPLDWDITASTREGRAAGGMEMKCVVQTMTPVDAASIPPGSKP